MYVDKLTAIVGQLQDYLDTIAPAAAAAFRSPAGSPLLARLGMNNNGEPVYVDRGEFVGTEVAFVSGATGSGKSVVLSALSGGWQNGGAEAYVCSNHRTTWLNNACTVHVDELDAQVQAWSTPDPQRAPIVLFLDDVDLINPVDLRPLMLSGVHVVMTSQRPYHDWSAAADKWHAQSS